MDKVVTIVSGLPRSGTSLMMKMLQAGGMELLIDNVRCPDVDNPKGYFEYEKVKKLKSDNSWITLAQGRAVKIISALLIYLPDEFQYRIILMQRNMQEILASQHKMLEHSHKQPAANDEKMAGLYTRHLQQVTSWLETKKNISFCPVSFNTLLTDPEQELVRLEEFFNGSLQGQVMLKAIDQTLYRRKAN